METKFKPYEFLVLNIPHASDNIPEHFMPNWAAKRLMRLELQGNEAFHFSNRKRDKKLYTELYRLRSKSLIDWYTDELFHTDRIRVTKVVSEICRTLCDVERMVYDPLEKIGYGIINKRMIKRSYPYSSGGSHIAFKEEFFDPTCKELLEYYTMYQSRLVYTIMNNAYWVREKYFGDNSVLLIDCHSFSSMPTALCDPGPQEEQVDICLGYNDDATCPPQELIDFVASYFENLGYRVGRNSPFSHSKTVECPVPYHSLMIEVNKRCYMNEQTLEKTEGFQKLQHAIQSLYAKFFEDIQPGNTPKKPRKMVFEFKSKL
jgi:N-formylglutamate amidohydrolase